jgi:hypothetical protein
MPWLAYAPRPPRSAAFFFDADPLENGTRRRGGLAKRIESLTIPDGRPSVACRQSRAKEGNPVTALSHIVTTVSLVTPHRRLS